MMMKTLTAGVLAISLGLTSLAPTTATAGPDEDAIAGILALLLFGAAVHELRDNRRSTPDPAPTPAPAAANWRVLPVDCIRNVTRRNGNVIRIFGQRCLNRNYEHPRRLPEACRVNVRTENGQRRQGYRVRCMRNEGFRTNRR